MNSTGLIITIILSILIFLAPKHWAVLGVMAGVIYITQSQEVIVSGINFTSIRILELAGFIRVIVRREFSWSKINDLDKSVLLFYCFYLLIYLLRSILVPSLTESRWYRVGSLYDVVLTYFLFRGLISDVESFNKFLKNMVLLIIPFTVFLIIEGVTGKNLFYFMGGVTETSVFREGYYRCQGSFRHAITAGSFGATLIPLYIYLTTNSGFMVWGISGILLGIIITISSHSSGPLMCAIAGITAWFFWPLRKKMKVVRWAAVFFTISLHLSMKAPVWFIFDRISGVIGGDGWHRSNLIDKFINHFGEWWLIGMPIENSRDWAATQLISGTVDVTNEYVSVGLSGGLISIILFFSMFKKYYQVLGNSMNIIRKDITFSKKDELLLWGLGSVLFSHMINLTAVSYWDQSYVIWFMLLAVISSITIHYAQYNNIISKEPYNFHIFPSTSIKINE